MYRIKKVKRGNKEQYFPQRKGAIGWANVHYDFYFEEFNLAKDFLDEYTTPNEEEIEYIEYNNPKAKKRVDIMSSFFRMFMGD